MMLYPGEQAIASDRVEAIVGPQVRLGNLHLTNLRLVFEGFFQEPAVGWVPRTVLDLHLGYVTNVVAVPGAKERHTLRVEAGLGYVYTFVSPIAHKWMEAILRAKQQAPAAPSSAARPGAANPVVVNVQSAPSQPSVFLHCKHCGSLTAAGSVHCTSCGATL